MIDVVELTRQLVAIPSPSRAEGPVVDFMHETLTRLGWSVERQAVAPGRDNLFARVGEPVVVLSTHLDCVPPYVPLREDDEYLHGRGTCDAKGLAAAMVAAAEALRADGETGVALLFVVGEEIGSDGAIRSNALEPRGRFLINGEPTEGRVSIGQMGVLHVTLRARGREAHSAYPEEGTSAVLPILDQLDRLRRMPLPCDELLGQSTLNVGIIRGGSAVNVIPGEAEACLLIRTVGPSGPLREQILAEQIPGVEISFPAEIPAHRGIGLEGWETTVVRFASDLPHLTEWGTRYQLGPGTIRVAHTAEERIAKSELRQGVAEYARLARQLLQVA